MTDTARQPRRRKPARQPLSRDRVARAAVQLADREGLDAVSMRRIGQELDVEAMSLYNHVASKDALLDAMVEQVAAEVNAAVAAASGPDPATDWRGALRARALTARAVMLQHKWAPDVLQSRTTMTVDVVRYFDGVVAILQAGGFSHDLTHHSLHALGSRVLGFTQELFDPGDAPAEASEQMLAAMAAEVPHLAEMLSQVTHDDAPAATLGWCDDQTEFEFGLDVVLEGLEQRRAATG